MMQAMQVALGTAGLKETYQADFTETITDPHISRGSDGMEICLGESRIAFVAHEVLPPGQDGRDFAWVCDLHPNKYNEGEAWLHDGCAVAVYFCKKCLTATVRWNQG